MRRLRLLVFIFVLFTLCTTAAFAELPDLPKQELWVKIISTLVGLAVIFAICILGLNRILYGPVGMDALLATKMSVIIAIILSFLWFLYLFGQIFNTTLLIAAIALAVVVIIIVLLRGGDSSPVTGDDDDDEDDFEFDGNY